MSQIGSVPAGVLATVVEKLVAKMDERDLCQAYEAGLSAMPAEAVRWLSEAALEAFRERGESSEDVAEGAGTAAERIATGEPDAIAALVKYAQANPGVLKEATTLFVEQHPEFIAMLPATLYHAIERRLSANP